LKNILIHQHKINRNVSDSVATIFKDTLEYAGLYVNGIIVSSPGVVPDEGQGSDGSIVPVVPIKPAGPPPVQMSAVKIPVGMQSVTLPSGLMISYSSDIAYFFALGKFGPQIEALEKAVNAALKKNDDGTTTPPTE
jgi:hypothetical protein